MTAPSPVSAAAPVPRLVADQVPVLEPDQLIALSQRRYATKKYDPARTIPASHWAALEQALLYSASSSGLQPWRFLVITDRAVREQLVPHSFGQRQIAVASHLVVFLARTSLDSTDIDRWLARVGEVRGTPADQIEAQRQRLTANLVTTPRPGFHAVESARYQVHIALGQFLTSAILLGIDTCAHGGFDPAAYDRLLGLDGGRYRSVVLATAGYHAANDANAHAAKVRFPLEEVVQHRASLA